jgi:magnesium chelatase subunit D
VGLVCFRGTGAELLLPPTGSVDLAQVCLQEMPTGGRTPLSRGLSLALEVLEQERLKDRQVLPLMVLLTDGRANVGLGGGPVVPGKDEEVRGLASLVREQRIPALVIDTELDFIKLGLAQGIAEAMGAACLKLDDLRSESLAQAVRLHAPGGEAPLQTPDQMLAMARQVTGPG